jgi:hypothetical protein
MKASLAYDRTIRRRHQERAAVKRSLLALALAAVALTACQSNANTSSPDYQQGKEAGFDMAHTAGKTASHAQEVCADAGSAGGWMGNTDWQQGCVDGFKSYAIAD